MNYQDIQDYADMLYNARVGVADYKEVISVIHRAKPTPSELSAIQVLAEYCVEAHRGIELDWNFIKNKIKDMLK